MKFALVYLFAISIIVYVYGWPQGNDINNVNNDQCLSGQELKQYTYCILDESNNECPKKVLEIKSEYYALIIVDLRVSRNGKRALEILPKFY